MRLTKSYLKQIIQEELSFILERGFGEGVSPSEEIYAKREVYLEEEQEEIDEDDSKKYRICTDSIAKTAGTTKRSEWSKAAKKRYDRCLKKVD